MADRTMSYQYYWIKFATKKHIDDLRKKIMADGGDPAKAEPQSGGVVPPPRMALGAGTYSGTVVPNPPKPGSSDTKRAQSMGLGQGTLSGTVVPNPIRPSRMVRVYLGFLLEPAYANEKGMVIDTREMPLDYGREDAEAWIHGKEGKEWAADQFCALTYVAAEHELLPERNP